MTTRAISIGVNFHDVARVTLRQHMPNNDNCICLKLDGYAGELPSDITIFGLPAATAAKIAEFFLMLEFDGAKQPTETATAADGVA